jgi:threonine dehydratase
MSKSFRITKKKIEKAHIKISPFIHNTPVLSSELINQIIDCQVFFKCENFQKIGAFKMRGASYAISQLNSEQRKKGVTTHSSGNHAQAIALAAKQQKINASIVMPRTAPMIKIKGVKTYHGKITFCEPNIKARQEGVDQIIKKTGAVFIHPFNDLNVITGQATCAKEIIESNLDLDLIICPVGGGGLLAGTILSAHYFGKNIKVYGAEPEEVNDAYRALKSGKVEFNKTTNTIADGLMTNLGKLNFEIIKEGIEEILIVSEEEIKAAMRIIWERLKIIVEPSSAVAFAAIIKNKEKFIGRKIGLILTGGNVDLDDFFNAI